MPADNLLPGLSAGSSAFNGILGAVTSAIQNRKQRDYEREMYQTHKQDNIDFWNMQNQYNSPVMQMQRLKSAGLNPNLMYGQSASAGNASSVSTPSPNTSSSKPITIPQTNFIQDMYDLKQKSAQTDLLRQQIETQNSVAVLNAMTSQLRQLEQEKLKTDNAFSKATLDNRIKTVNVGYDQALANLANTQQQTNTSRASEDNLRQQIASSAQDMLFKAQNQHWTLQQLAQNVSESIVRQAKMKSEIGQIRSNTKLTDLKKIEQNFINEFAKYGIRPGENITSFLPKIAGSALESITQFTLEQLNKFFPIPKK